MRIEQIIWSIIGFSTAILFAVILTGCKVQKPIQQTRDSVRVEYHLDSVYVYKHDSVFRDRWRAGDTIYITTEKWRTQYRDKIVERHDTIASVQTEQVEVRYVPDYFLEVGQVVNAKITAIDFDKKRVSLSMRALLTDGEAPAQAEETAEE